MEIQASRIGARLNLAGEPVPLLEQNRGRWDRLLIRRGFTALLRAQALLAQRPASLAERPGGLPGPYVLQAAIAACHAHAPAPADTDWDQIVLLYQALAALTPSPVVELNRAVAVAMRDGPAAGLALIDAILARGELAEYHLAHAARADLLRRLGRRDDACTAYERALELVRQEPERRFLLKRLSQL